MAQAWHHGEVFCSIQYDLPSCSCCFTCLLDRRVVFTTAAVLPTAAVFPTGEKMSQKCWNSKNLRQKAAGGEMVRCTIFGITVAVQRKKNCTHSIYIYTATLVFFCIYDYFLFYFCPWVRPHYYFGPFFKIPATQDIFKGGLKIDCSKYFAR